MMYNEDSYLYKGSAWYDKNTRARNAYTKRVKYLNTRIRLSPGLQELGRLAGKKFDLLRR